MFFRSFWDYMDERLLLEVLFGVSMEETGGFLFHDGFDDIRRLRGLLAGLDELRIAKNGCKATHHMKMELDVLTAEKEEEMDGVAVGGIEINAFLRIAIDDAAWHLEGRNRITGMRDGDAVADGGAENALAGDALLLQVTDVENQIAEDFGIRQLFDDIFDGFAVEVHNDA